MTSAQLPTDVAVVLINLGTPDAPEPRAVRRYLLQFLSDRRVIEIPSIIWQPVLRSLILTTRPRKSARAYGEVWTNEGSPLLAIGKRQRDALEQRLDPKIAVGMAMRYGQPAIDHVIHRLAADDYLRILAAPLYPQYCAATTASAQDAVFTAAAELRRQPTIRILPPYFDDPLYIDALKLNLMRQIEALDFEPERLLLSFHGMPERTRALGDPYHDQCLETARLLGAAMCREVDVAFQSRFGRARWLEPATADMLAGYPAKGVKRIVIAAPGFSADCLETLEELGIRGRETFLGAGGEAFARLDCLNDSPEGMHMLEQLVRRELAGWLPPA